MSLKHTNQFTSLISSKCILYDIMKALEKKMHHINHLPDNWDIKYIKPEI